MRRDYSDFDAQADEAAEPSPGGMVQAEAVAIGLQSALNRFLRETLPYLSREQLVQVAHRLPADILEQDLDQSQQAYNSDFSVVTELALQIQAVQSLRQHVFPGGRMKHDASVKEAREVVTTCNQLINTLTNTHAKIMNMERMRAVEAATVDVLADLDAALKEKFLRLLAVKLEEIE